MLRKYIEYFLQKIILLTIIKARGKGGTTLTIHILYFCPKGGSKNRYLNGLNSLNVFIPFLIEKIFLKLADGGKSGRTPKKNVMKEKLR